MKKISISIIILLLTVSSAICQISVFDCDAFNSLVTQNEIEAANYEYYKQCILFGDNQNYLFNGSSNKKVTAANEIHIKPGFHAGAYNSDGGMWLNIAPKSDFDVAVINYPDLNNVLKYEKLELGVQLPQEILTKVNNFIAGLPDVPISEKINPYLDWEMRVYAEFICLSSNIQPIIIDGFYTKDFNEWNAGSLSAPANGDNYTFNEYKSIGGWDEVATDYPFRVRFAPPAVGKWMVNIKIQVGQNPIQYVSSDFIFKVIESGNPGYVEVGNNRRFMKYDGHTFFPVGCNLPWPVTDTINDPELYNNLSYTDNNGVYYRSDEDYSDNYAAPRVYDSYKNILSNLADNGANYYRSIMYPSSTEIEWEKLGDYTERLHMAKEMDEIVELSKDRGMFIHWDMQIHYSFQFSENAYGKKWCWDSYQSGTPFCYKTLIGTDYPVDFFTDEDAKKYYKQRLRYILARWGYSTGIAVFELFSEISNVGTDAADNSEFYQTGSNWQLSNNWQDEMAAYVKSHYNGKIHLLTASYAGAKVPADNIFENPNMDIMTSNIYDYGKPDFSNFWIKNVSKNYLNEGSGSLNCYTTLNEKPMLFSETDPLDASCDFNIVEIQRSMWQGMFSGLAGSLSWDVRKHPEVFPIFGQMSNFISQFNLEEERWHPGASELYDYADQRTWRYVDNYAKDMDGEVNPKHEGGKRERKADLSYLRSWDGNYVIGVITNKSYNIYTIDDCFDTKWDEWTNPNLHSADLLWELPITPANPVDCEDEKLKIRGLHGSKYYVNYFLTNNLSVPIHSSDDVGPKVKIEYTVPSLQNGYITLFMARRKNYDWYLVNEDITLNEVETERSTIESSDSSLIFDQELQNYFQLFPNPVNNEFTLTKGISEEIEVEVCSLDGKVMIRFHQFEQNKIIDISQLQNGFYMVKISVLNELVKNFKIIKQ